MSEVIEQAKTALANKNYSEAVELYTKALASSKDAELYVGRARAYNKLDQNLEAVADCTTALELNPKLATAHKEKATALFALDEFESAKAEFEAASVLEPHVKYYKTWINMCLVQMGEQPLPLEQPKASQPPAANPIEQQQHIRKRPTGATTSTHEIVEITDDNEDKSQPVGVKIDDPEYSRYWKAPLSAAAAALTDSVPAAGIKYRHQWFQSETKVEVGVLAKRLPKDRVSVDIQPNHLVVVTRDEQGNEDYRLDVELFATIVPESSVYEVLSNKVEVRLEKADKGKQWASLEAGGNGAAAPGPTNGADTAAALKEEKLAYPYAGKKVNWDQVEKEVVKEEDAEEVTGDAAVMKLFKKLYADGDDDSRRAMMKSYQESGGKALSNNWKDAADKNYRKEFLEKK